MGKPIVAAALLCAASFGCAGSAPPPNTTPDARAFMAMQHFERLEHFHDEMILSYRGRRTIENATVFRPDRSALYLPQMHQIDVSVRDQRWIESYGFWTKCEKSPRDSGTSNEAAFSREAVQRRVNRSTVTRERDDVIGGVRVAHFHFETRPDALDRSPSTTDMWIGIADGLPRKTTGTWRGGTMIDRYTSFGKGLTFPDPPPQAREGACGR